MKSGDLLHVFHDILPGWVGLILEVIGDMDGYGPMKGSKVWIITCLWDDGSITTEQFEEGVSNWGVYH